MEEINESWMLDATLDLTLPPLPPRSRLFCLEPLGIGTPSVESLTGYIARLAREHNVTPYALIKFEIAPLTPELYVFEADNHVNIPDYTAFNHSGRRAAKFVAALERLTLRSELRYLTLLPWGNLVQPHGLFRRLKAWCPGCYSSQYNSNKSNYDLLLWSFRCVSLCAEHNLTLIERCPYCRSAMRWLAGRANLGYCSRCHRWLGRVADYEDLRGNAEQTEQYQRWLIKEIGRMLAGAPLLPDTLSRETLAQSLSKLIKRSPEGRSNTFARLLNLPEPQIDRWIAGVLPRFDVITRICYVTGVPVFDFLAGTISDGQSIAWPESIPRVVYRAKRRKTKRKPYDMDKKVELVRGALYENPPPSIDEVAKRLGYVSGSRLYVGVFRPLGLKITARHAKYEQQRHIKEFEPIRRLLLSELNRKEGRPLPIRQVCFLPDGKKHYFIYHKLFPELCAALKAKHQQYVMVEKKRKQEAIIEEIRRVATMLYCRGEFPSTPKVAALMQTPSHMSRKFARNALRETQVALGLRTSVAKTTIKG